MSGIFDLGRIKLQICVNNDRGSKKIHRAMMENGDNFVLENFILTAAVFLLCCIIPQE